MSTEPPRPLVQLQVAGTPPAPVTRFDTVLPAEPEAALADLADARGAGGVPALARVCGHHPTLLDAWAWLGQAHLDAGDAVTAYACARTGYHRGLDRLRKHGWGGTGMVRWVHPGNRGFLRSLHVLLAASATLGETDESSRCRGFLLELDPDDELGVHAYPEVPGPDLALPAPPED